MKNKKSGILLLILLLAVGFATVSTTLVINGTIPIATNEEDFNVIFTKATMDNGNATISSNSKQIDFETNTLSLIGDTATLDYTIKNTSTQYDADVTVSITINDGYDE